MNVRDLIDILEGYPEEAEVRMAHQPSWPFEYSIDSYSNIVLINENDPPDDDEIDDDEIDDGSFDPDSVEDAKWVVYLPEGNQIGYLPGAVAKKMGWR